ncbi:MAG TPA: nuclear transport factor 2 family protein [Terriglobia bacterium]|nr:nuclear transport factor 2 family protein [Terriglobia bacterium]
MNRISASLVIVALSAALSSCDGANRSAAQGGAKLEPQDYIDIRQLIESYSQILDNCANNGNTYADLFTDDATFGVSSQWGGGAKIWFRGREQLRGAGGGGKDECRPPRPNPEYHIVISPVITSAPGGAKATSTLLTITNKTTRQGDIIHWEGGYEDTFEKTANGWRFKSRVHVWPEINWTDNPADMPPRDLEKE